MVDKSREGFGPDERSDFIVEEGSNSGPGNLAARLSLFIARYNWIILIVALAAGFRLYGIAEHGLWLDERFSVSNAVGSILTEPIVQPGSFTAKDFWAGNTIHNLVEATIKQDSGNAILFNSLLHFWINLFGTRDAVVRLLPALFGIAVVPLVYLVARSLGSERVARIAGLLAALHPFLIHFSQETRSYAMATSLSLAATLVFVRLVVRGGPEKARLWSYLLYGLLVAAALLSHYLTVSIFFGHALFAVLRVRDRKMWLNLVMSAALAVAVVGGWMYAAGSRGLKVADSINRMYQKRAATLRAGEDWSLPATPHNILAGEVQMAFAMVGNLLPNASLRLTVLSPLLVIPLVLLAFCWQAYRKRNVASSTLLFLVVLTVSSPVFSAILALRAGHIISLQPLYANFAIPYLIILLAIGIAQAMGIRRGLSWTKLLVVAQALILLASIKLVYDDAPRFRPANIYRASAERILAATEPGDTVVYSSWHDARLCNLYLPQTASILQRVEPNEPDDSIEVVRSDQTRFELVRLLRHY
jgi:hypothetical protein